MGGSWSVLRAAGRDVDVFTPSGSRRGAAIFLHGADLKTFQRNGPFEAAFSEQGLLVACPRGGQCWWLDQKCRAFGTDTTPLAFVRDSVCGLLENEFGLSPPTIGLTGIGMGGQGALNLSFRHARQFPVVAAISPDVDFHQWHGRGLPLDEMFDSPEAARQQTATLHLHPLNWPPHMLIVCDPADRACFDGTERLVSKLRSTGIPFEADLDTRGGGHSCSYFERMIPRVARFLGEHLGAL
jgi:S-formylglutathione hydrolase